MNPYIIPGLLNSIESVVASQYGVTIDEIRSDTRCRPIPEARFMAMYFMKKRYPNLHWREVGAMFGKHHSTAVYATRFVENMLSVDKNFQKRYSIVESLIL